MWSYTGYIDYNSGPYNVTFPIGITRVSFNVLINDDNILEENEDFDLIVVDGSLPHHISSGDPGMARIILMDDDGN